MKPQTNNSEMIMYADSQGQTKIDVRFQDDTVWLTQEQMAALFDRERSVISKHIKNVFAENELEEKSNVQILHIPNSDKPVAFYSLNVIISVGYRVKSQRGTQFRIWATKRIHEYLQKGFTMNDDLLKKSGGGSYWKELLTRIRDIRSNEKVFYRQLLDLFATSVDYDPKTETCQHFFKIIQNKMHYAVNKQTAPEIIHSRANAELPFMGLKSFSGEQPLKDEAHIAKNYLTEKELEILNRMVSAFFELAELHAVNHENMYMKDWIPQVDDFAERYGKGILHNAGTVSHQTAIEKATEEYKKYRNKIADEPSSAECDYLESIKSAQKKIEKK